MSKEDFFSYGNTRFRYNENYSGEVTIIIAQEEGPKKELKVSTPAIAAFAAHLMNKHLGGFPRTLPQEDLLWEVLDSCHSGTEYLGKVRAKTSAEAYEKAEKKFGKKYDTDDIESLAVRLA